MAHIYRPQWTTTSGGIGESVMIFEPSDSVAGSQAFATEARAFFDAIKTLLPTDVEISFPGEVAVHNDSTGTLTTVVAVTPGASVVGTGASVYAAPCGARLRWQTGIVINGRRLTGTTFIVPLVSGAYDASGTLTASAITTMQTAGEALRTGALYNYSVWHRPVAGSGGASYNAIGVSVPDKVAVLRSRRD